MSAPDARHANGLALAAAKRSQIRMVGTDLWLVPSSRGPGGYVVDLARGTCSCPDFERRGLACKHIVAAGVVADETALADEIESAPVANDVTAPPAPEVAYRRHAHAAHYAHGHSKIGHDLECWTVAQPVGAPRPAGVPGDATADYGYVIGGVQHVVWRRRAPLSPGKCPMCPASRAEVAS